VGTTAAGATSGTGTAYTTQTTGRSLATTASSDTTGAVGTSNLPSNSNSSSTSIVGIVIGAFLGGVVLVAAVVTLLLCRKKLSKRFGKPTLNKNKDGRTTASTLDFQLNITKSKTLSSVSLIPEQDERITEITNVEVKKKLGSGKSTF
jgi:hypothetical protein